MGQMTMTNDVYVEGLKSIDDCVTELERLKAELCQWRSGGEDTVFVIVNGKTFRTDNWRDTPPTWRCIGPNTPDWSIVDRIIAIEQLISDLIDAAGMRQDDTETES